MARQLQTGDSEALVFSDDDEEHHHHHAGAGLGVGAAAGAVTMSAAPAAGVVGRSANRQIPVGPVGAAPVERGGLLGSSEGGSTMMLNGEFFFFFFFFFFSLPPHPLSSLVGGGLRLLYRMGRVKGC